MWNTETECPITAPSISASDEWIVIGYDDDKNGHEDDRIVGDTHDVSENDTYYAQIRRAPIQKYITFDVNGNTSFKY
jgi:hypothetical protein